MAQKILIRFYPDKKSASVRQGDGPKSLNPISSRLTNFNPILPRQKIVPEHWTNEQKMNG